MMRFETSRLCYQCLLSVEVGVGEVGFPNSTRLRMRSLNCVPEDMPCGWATAVVAMPLNKGCSSGRNMETSSYTTIV